ncbi:MAG: MmcQ/YjbR family DNA-binding protein [Paludibacter sp.]|nr:MmcQ/YjbR family DNA-binding protein [Paludibacter sp.]MDD4427275.1 MmcQ/YjbR family DNA-binding protein [Paludibacter sp.]
MNFEDLREYCISLKGVTEHFPFDDVSLVLKVQGKMFALIPLDNPETQIALKCDPEKAVALREQFDCITPAYHFNKKHWNSVRIDPAITTEMLCELIHHSYDLVVAGLPKKLKKELGVE